MPEDFAQTLYRILPALYRERDESGDLRAYLEGCGDLLDAVYATLRQRYGDNYPDNPEPGAKIAPAQEWLLPYFADLVDARLLSPLAEGRRAELGSAIRWRQGKGTLATIDSIVEALGQTESVVQEGWQRVAVTPRLDQPLRPATSFGYAQEPRATSPGNMARHPDLPAATVDMRCPSRAIAVPGGTPGAQSITIDGQEDVWRQGSLHGAPCFPGSYEDVSPRTPDMRTPDWRVGHYHPRRVLAYLPPPSGFFPPNAPVAVWQASPSAGYRDLIAIDDSVPGRRVHRNRSLDAGRFVPVRVNGQVDLDAADPGITEWVFEGIAFRRGVTSGAARLQFHRCAVETAETGRNDLFAPAIRMRACLVERLRAPNGRLRLEGVTVLRDTRARGIEASECIFGAFVSAPADAAAPPPDGGCIRYSRIEPEQPRGTLELWRTTTEAPVFFEPDYARRHAGVVSPATHATILEGAEDGGEMGAFLEARHAAIRAAIAEKLTEFLPMGQEAVLIPDIRLTIAPWSGT